MRVSREELLKQIELDNNTHNMRIEDILLNTIEIGYVDAGCMRLVTVDGTGAMIQMVPMYV